MTVICKDLPSLANETAARNWVSLVFLTPVPEHIIEDGGSLIITSEMARN
jgi:hypothetical protein